jgi:antitoxin component YwqK of YwqJK toxin-antitoxin module
MKKILILIIVLLASALYFQDELKQIISPPEVTVKYKDLIERDGLKYQKFSEVPFTGKVSGSEKGSFKNGKREGAFINYHQNGQLSSKGNYTNDKQEGDWVRYHDNGQLDYTGNYNKNGKKEGEWVIF